mmetsp:Transcript_34782/g.90756  ORF Transcript_34782/g.90756 Transcript_34782/m.90756 type:complete len:269 (-) Transcript_34782:1573-2379(-)
MHCGPVSPNAGSLMNGQSGASLTRFSSSSRRPASRSRSQVVEQPDSCRRCRAAPRPPARPARTTRRLPARRLLPQPAELRTARPRRPVGASTRTGQEGGPGRSGWWWTWGARRCPGAPRLPATPTGTTGRTPRRAVQKPEERGGARAPRAGAWEASMRTGPGRRWRRSWGAARCRWRRRWFGSSTPLHCGSDCMSRLMRSGLALGATTTGAPPPPTAAPWSCTPRPPATRTPCSTPSRWWSPRAASATCRSRRKSSAGFPSLSRTPRR